MTNPPLPEPGQTPQPQYSYQPPQQHTRTITTGGLPIWMHLCYAFLGWIPCFLGWIIWPIHWWFAQSKSVATQATVAYQPPVYPQQQYPPQHEGGQRPPQQG